MNKNSYLEAMGIQVWKARRDLPFAKQVEQSLFATDAVAKETSEKQETDWNLLQRQVSQCTACDLSLTRSNTVFGAGNINADLMIIGEAPGKEEEQKGEPFVGPAGHVLTQMLAAIGILREDVFIANVLKCHPPENRDPKQDEIRSCTNFLIQQINFIQPKLILAVGRISAQTLLHSKEPVAHIRGEVYEYGSDRVPLVATYHPAYLIRFPLEKSKVWEDLLVAKRLLES